MKATDETKMEQILERFVDDLNAGVTPRIFAAMDVEAEELAEELDEKTPRQQYVAEAEEKLANWNYMARRMAAGDPVEQDRRELADLQASYGEEATLPREPTTAQIVLSELALKEKMLGNPWREAFLQGLSDLEYTRLLNEVTRRAERRLDLLWYMYEYEVFENTAGPDAACHA